MAIEIRTKTPQETMLLGSELASQLRGGDILLLTGPLGAGKTVLVRGIVSGLDAGAAEHVTSQSYVVAARYPTRPEVAHLDLYRLTEPEEVVGLGFEEMIYSEEIIAVVEWPELLSPFLEEDDPVLRLHLSRDDVGARTITASTDLARLDEAFREAARRTLAQTR